MRKLLETPYELWLLKIFWGDPHKLLQYFGGTLYFEMDYLLQNEFLNKKDNFHLGQ